MINPSQHRPSSARPPEDEAEQQHRAAWITRVRTMHRNKRMLGLAGIILGAALVMWGRLTPEAPSWALTAGFAVLAVSWIVFVYVIYDSWRWVKKNPYKPGAPPA